MVGKVLIIIIYISFFVCRPGVLFNFSSQIENITNTVPIRVCDENSEGPPL